MHEDKIQRQYKAFNTKHCPSYAVFLQNKIYFCFRWNSQASNLALISYCHLSVTLSSQYLIQPTDPCVRIIPLPPPSSWAGWDNAEKETETTVDSKLNSDWQHDAAVEKAKLILWCIE